jgi:crossover junction endodeoxyribonuclease RuvC
VKIILGIDPGSQITGYGIIRTNGLRHEHLASGSIRLREGCFAKRLKKLFDELNQVILEHQPIEAAIEEVFMAQNPNVALKLGQARGAAILTAAMHSLPVAEYSVRKIKQAVVGYGAATKSQIQHMICHLLKLPTAPEVDAADALAAALCHAMADFTNLKMKIALQPSRGKRL